jgi:hypothetical protein
MTKAKPRLHVLERLLGDAFGLDPKKQLTKQQQEAQDWHAAQHRKAYAEFRAACKRDGLTYKVSRDGYVELSDGRAFPHFGDWAETLERLREPT